MGQLEYLKQPDRFRDSLSRTEKEGYDYFVQANKRKPDCMWELMTWCATQQNLALQERKFWGGVFGL